MELDELRSILKNSGVDLWDFIDTAISVAILDHGNELPSRRDAIVERLYTPLLFDNSNSDGNYEIPKRNIDDDHKLKTEENSGNYEIPKRNIDDDHKLKTEENSVVDYEEDLEINKILRIKNHFEISNQSENCLVDLLQCLAEMDISFKVLEKTDIGRHVNRLRKHSSNEVRRLVKLLIRRWKDIVDEWVRLNTLVEETVNNFQDDFKDGANISNGSSSYCSHKHSVEKNNISPSSKRLREDYLEEHYAKIGRRREVEVEDVDKPKNSVVANNISGFQAKYW